MSGWSELLHGKASIYALNEITKQWLDRGSGGSFIMYQNSSYPQDIRIKWSKNKKDLWWKLMNGTLKAKGERAWVLKAWDISNNKQEILAIRFPDVQLSQQFSIKFRQVFPPQQQQQPQGQNMNNMHGQNNDHFIDVGYNNNNNNKQSTWEC
eukprot:484988_1